MAVNVRIPTPLQKITKNEAVVQGSGLTVKDVLASLEITYPGLHERIYDDKGTLRRFINFYVNDEDIRFLQGENTLVKDGDEISVVPAIAGGR